MEYNSSRLENIVKKTFWKKATGFLSSMAMLASLSITQPACLSGSFSVVRLNDAPAYQEVKSNEDIKKITLVYLNAADLRGNTPDLFEFVPEEEVRKRAKWLADYLVQEKIDAAFFGEVDYKESVKTGKMDQPKIIAEYMGDPYNYVIYDEYLKSIMWTTGNGGISSFAVKPVHRQFFGDDGYYLDKVIHTYKDYFHSKLKVGKRELDVIVNHFESNISSTKMMEAEEVLDYVTELKRNNPNISLLVLGDFNSTCGSPPMNKLLSNGILQLPPNPCMKTYPADNPVEDIDHVLFNNLRITNYRTFFYPWSDHLGLIFDVEFLD